MSKSILNSYFLFILILIIAGIFILYPALNFQEGLSQGDHGRDLYSFKQTYEGFMPYKDYWSQNGPLMPYYYAFIYRLFRPTIQSTLLGYNLLVLLTGIFLFLASSRIMSNTTALLCALWYWAIRGTELFYTYNHIGAICLVSAVLFSAFSYLKNPRQKYVLFGFICIFFTILIRPNIGVAALASFYFSLLMCDYTNKSNVKKSSLKYLSFSVAVILLSFFVYQIFLSQIPAGASDSELGYLSSADPTKVLSALISLPNILFSFFTMNIFYILCGMIFLFCLVKFAITLTKNNNEKGAQIKTTALILIIFSAAIMCEYLFSAKWFRYRWAFGPMFILFFLIIDTALTSSKKRTSVIIKTFLLITIIFSVTSYHRLISFNKNKNVLLNIGENKVYLVASQKQWLSVVTQGTNTINELARNDKTILAAPYDPIYYFLSNKHGAARALKIYSDKQIENIIDKNPKLHLIILSNRHNKITFQQDIKNKGFAELASFGAWDKPASWIGNHAIKIYKR